MSVKTYPISPVNTSWCDKRTPFLHKLTLQNMKNDSFLHLSCHQAPDIHRSFQPYLVRRKCRYQYYSQYLYHFYFDTIQNSHAHIRSWQLLLQTKATPCGKSAFAKTESASDASYRFFKQRTMKMTEFCKTREFFGSISFKAKRRQYYLKKANIDTTFSVAF